MSRSLKQPQAPPCFLDCVARPKSGTNQIQKPKINRLVTVSLHPLRVEPKKVFISFLILSRLLKPRLIPYPNLLIPVSKTYQSRYWENTISRMAWFSSKCRLSPLSRDHNVTSSDVNILTRILVCCLIITQHLVTLPRW